MADKQFAISCLYCGEAMITVPRITALAITVLRGHLRSCWGQELPDGQLSLSLRGHFSVTPNSDSAVTNHLTLILHRSVGNAESAALKSTRLGATRPGAVSSNVR